MVSLYYGTISVMRSASGTADVIIPDRGNAIISNVPFLERVTTFPKVGEMVACLFDEDETKINRSVIIGRIYSNGNTPSTIGAGAFTLTGSDVKINGNTTAKSISASSLKADSVKADSVSSDSVSANGISLSEHTHHYTWETEEGEGDTDTPN